MKSDHKSSKSFSRSIYPEHSNRILNPHREFRRKAEASLGFTVRSTSKKWKDLIFPSTVDLIKSPNETLKYFNLAHRYYRKGKNVFYDLSNITRFSSESIAVLAACISSNHFTRYGHSRGNIPNNPFLATMFRESGFFEHMEVEGRLGKTLGKNKLVHKITDDKVVPSVAKNCCKSLMNKIHVKYEDDLEPLYVILIEAMQNTNNHASAGKEVEYDWWLYEFEDSHNGLMHYTFLDIGVGLFQSLPVKNYIQETLKLLNLKSNLDIVDDLIAGKIKSRTLKPNRGKGIPQIYDQSKDSLFEEFYIISNDIFINTKTDEKIELREQFHGTLYHWTIKITKK